MSLTQATKPALQFPFNGSNVDSISGTIGPTSQVSPGLTQIQGSAALVSTAPTSNTAVYFPGSAGSYMNLGTSSPASFDLGTNNLFVEAWVYFGVVNAVQSIASRANLSGGAASSAHDWILYLENGTIKFFLGNGTSISSVAQSSGTVTAGAWTHVAVSYISLTSAYIFINGAPTGPTSITFTPVFNSYPFLIGYGAGSYIINNGYIQDLRVVKGGTVPTTSFTPVLPPFSSPLPYSLTGTPVYTLLGQFITYKSGKIQNQAINFPNSSSTGTTAPTTYVEYTVSLNSTPGFTISLWVNFNGSSPTGAQVVLMASGSNILYLTGSNRLNYYDGSVNTVAFPLQALTVGTWYNPVIVVSGTTVTLYLNGNSTVGTTVTIAPTLLRVGGSGSNFSAWCSVQDLRIYNTALSAIQVQALYANGGAPGVPASTTMVVSPYNAPIVSGYTYIPFNYLPSSFTLKRTSTGNFWTNNTSGPNAISDGGAYPTITLIPSQPSDIYSAANPGIWYRLQDPVTGNYVRHANFVMWLNSYVANNLDFAWAFYLQNGTTDQIKIYNAYGSDWVQSGVYTAGRIAISTSDPLQAHIYTMSSPVKTFAPLSGLSGTPLLSQLSVAPVAAFSLRAVKGLSTGGTAKAVQVRRASDNATQDFYADRLGNLLTAPVTGTDLATWLGGATGYVATWYDQSGAGKDATQTNQALRPSITLDSSNRYQIDFTANGGTSYFNATNGTVPMQTAYTVICRYNTIGNSSGGICGAGTNANGKTNNFRRNGSGYQNYWYGNDVNAPGYAQGTVVTFKFTAEISPQAGTTYVWANGVSQTVTGTNPRSGWAGVSGNELIGKTTNDVSMNGQMYSLFLFSSALSDSDRTAVENAS